jgi:hypothetical protein
MHKFKEVEMRNLMILILLLSTISMVADSRRPDEFQGKWIIGFDSGGGCWNRVIVTLEPDGDGLAHYGKAPEWIGEWEILKSRDHTDYEAPTVASVLYVKTQNSSYFFMFRKFRKSYEGIAVVWSPETRESKEMNARISKAIPCQE